jgi:hypothetical protein
MDLKDLYTVISLLTVGFVWLYVNIRSWQQWLKTLSIVMTIGFLLGGSAYTVLAILGKV